MSVRGDRERDFAALERDMAFENGRLAFFEADQNAPSVSEYMRRANLHLQAAELLEQLARVYDDYDHQNSGGMRRTP